MAVNSVSLDELLRWQNDLGATHDSKPNVLERASQKAYDIASQIPNAVSHPIESIIRPTTQFVADNARFGVFQAASLALIELPKIYYLQTQYDFNGAQDIPEFLIIQQAMGIPAKVGGAAIYLALNHDKGFLKSLKEYAGIQAGSMAANAPVSPWSQAATIGSMIGGTSPEIAYATKSLATLPFRVIGGFLGLKVAQQTDSLASHYGVKLEAVKDFALAPFRSAGMIFRTGSDILLDDSMLYDEQRRVSDLILRQVTQAHIASKDQLIYKGFL